MGIQGVRSNDPYPILAFSKTILRLFSFLLFFFFEYSHPVDTDSSALFVCFTTLVLSDLSRVHRLFFPLFFVSFRFLDFVRGIVLGSMFDESRNRRFYGRRTFSSWTFCFALDGIICADDDFLGVSRCSTGRFISQFIFRGNTRRRFKSLRVKFCLLLIGERRLIERIPRRCTSHNAFGMVNDVNTGNEDFR